MGKKAGLLLWILASASVLFSQKKVPDYIGHVNDFAGALATEQVNSLEQNLLNYETETSSQIAVVIEKTLNNGDAFSRSMDFAREWGVGTKEQRNGVLLYIAIADRKIEIRTADKTQGALTDGEIGDIIRNAIAPRFKEENYYQGINDGIEAIKKGLEGEFKAEKKKDKKPPVKGLLIALFIVIMLIVTSGRKGGGTGGLSHGGAFWLGTLMGGMGGGSGGSSSGGGGWGGFGGGGGFNGGGAGGSW